MLFDFFRKSAKDKKVEYEIKGLTNFHYLQNDLLEGDVFIRNTKGRPCVCCGKISEYLYDGLFYTDKYDSKKLDQSLCPECIRSGAAHEKFGVEFIPLENFYGEVEDRLKEEVAFRNPCYSSFQDTRWLCCCNAPDVYLGIMSSEEAEKAGILKEVEEAIHADFAPLDSDDVIEAYKQGETEGAIQIHVFRCEKCGKHAIWVDLD